MPDDSDERGLAARLWPLKELAVSGLFGSRSFPIGLDPSATILTGENGSGKSTLLRAIHLLGTGDWRAFADLPLDRLDLHFENGFRFTARRSDATLTLHTEHQAPWPIDLNALESIDAPRRYELDYLQRQVRATDSATERERLLAHERALRHHFLVESGSPQPDWVGQFVDRFGTKLISARRLEHRLRPDPTAPGEDAPIPVVEQFALRIRDRMRDELSVYAAESRRQEKVLPSQIVQAMQTAGPHDTEKLAQDVDGIRADVRQVADSLARVGLFQEEDPDQQFTEYPRDNESILLAIREVYSVTLSRLQRLTDLRSDLELFATFMNSRLANKRIELNQRTGINVALDGRERIRPSQLSSGEQQLLALAYELLFESEPQTVVLLDEPELSLHVAWLKGLLSSFLEMGESRELQYLIATHSPSVLAGHQARERSLDLA